MTPTEGHPVLGTGPLQDPHHQDHRPLVAFDFDGTLTKRDTMRHFLLTVRDHRTVAAAFLSHLPSIALAVRGGQARDRAKALVYQEILGGMTRQEADAACERTALVIEKSLIRDDAVARLRWHQNQQHRVIVVSASFEGYVRPVAASLGVEEVIATKWEIDPTDGTLTGRFDGPNVRGGAKVERIAEHIGRPCDLHYAYGNTGGDAAMLARARNPVWVRRRPMPELRIAPQPDSA
jgi:phosphatidylglycerophosphatase C